MIGWLITMILGCWNSQQALEVVQDHGPYPGLSPDVLKTALDAYACTRRRHMVFRTNRLTIIDFSQPSRQRRLWVLDADTGALLHHDYVAHGKYSGEDRTTAFSNVVDSKQSSLGVFRTAETYDGKNGYSLRLDGLEPTFNDNARERAIVIHGADYVSEAHIREYGRLGRSWGCPALPTPNSEAIIEDIKWGSVLVAYYPDTNWLERSALLHCEHNPTTTRE